MEDDLWRKTTLNGGQPLTEDDLLRKTTFVGRGPLMENDLWWKTTFDGRQPLMEDYLWWKLLLMEDFQNDPKQRTEINSSQHSMTTFNGRNPLMDDILWWKIILNGRCSSMIDTHGRQSWMEDAHRWKIPIDGRRHGLKTKFYGRQLSKEDDLWLKTPTLICHFCHFCYTGLNRFVSYFWFDMLGLVSFGSLEN